VVKWNYIEDSVSAMKEVMQMCKSESTKGCEHPERLKGKPGECSPEQITECHGDVKEHPCVKEK
jgi:hypothetical protein